MTWIKTLKQQMKKPANWMKKNKRTMVYLLKWIITLISVGLISFFMLCRLEVNAHVYLRNWLSPERPVAIEPLSHCFDNLSPDSPYHQGNKNFTVNFVPGLPVWEANTCYDFAALFHSRRYPYAGSQLYHTYWSSNLTKDFDEKPLATLRSFAATQNTNHTMILWIPKEDEQRLTNSKGWAALSKDTNRISYRIVQPMDLTKGTAIEPYVDVWRVLVSENNDGTHRDDLLRMLVLYQFGGVWFDLDTMFIRDLSPLFEHEWIAQGSCKTGMFGNPFTGALFHFNQKSPYVCEILEGAADLFKARERQANGESDIPKRHLIKGPEIFGSKLYYRIYRRVLHHRIKPWSILPWCFTDPSQCRRSNSMPSLFSNTDFDEKQVERIFAYHWRDRWSSVPGSIYNYLSSIHKKRITW
ncbi:hypothetical protein G6F70_003180 [Rhizopus microsporus]|nr:hypothetical protein G6F70_003180 [Rhizopus microsporus]RCH97405.1 hypothetical protein CU097_010892 [Rhizopus azygosporus]CEI90497.1 hypothetical protein RMCBS344292_04822 [Rhizopus microsporus]